MPVRGWELIGEMDEEAIKELEIKLELLRTEHRDLDDVISRLSGDPLQDELQLRRLKKRKLLLRDMIAKIESMLIPDIGA